MRRVHVLMRRVHWEVYKRLMQIMVITFHTHIQIVYFLQLLLCEAHIKDILKSFSVQANIF